MASRTKTPSEQQLRAVTPDLVTDRMAERIPGVPAAVTGRLTPNPEKQQQTSSTSISRSATPELVPDRMASRIPEPALARRLTPNPEQQMMSRVNAVGA